MPKKVKNMKIEEKKKKMRKVFKHQFIIQKLLKKNKKMKKLMDALDK